MTTTSTAEKTKSATSEPKVRPVPQGMHTVTPHLICAGAADAIEFYKKAFGAEELVRLPGPDGRLMHAFIRIGDSAVMMADEFPSCSESKGPKSLQGTPVILHIYVNDADALAKRAVDAGARLIMPVQEMFWGDRYGQVEDPFGHRWSIATHVRDLTQDEINEGAKKMMAGAGSQ
jgi:PhnB protein